MDIERNLREAAAHLTEIERDSSYAIRGRIELVQEGFRLILMLDQQKQLLRLVTWTEFTAVTAFNAIAFRLDWMLMELRKKK